MRNISIAFHLVCSVGVELLGAWFSSMGQPSAWWAWSVLVSLQDKARVTVRGSEKEVAKCKQTVVRDLGRPWNLDDLGRPWTSQCLFKACLKPVWLVNDCWQDPEADQIPRLKRDIFLVELKHKFREHMFFRRETATFRRMFFPTQNK